MHDYLAIRSGPAILNSTVSGNSGHDAGLKAWRKGVFDGQEEGIGSAHAPHPQFDVQGTGGPGRAAVIELAFARYGAPEIVNTDQGSQFTAEEFTSVVLAKGCKLSMDGRGAWRDNVFVERLWRSVKYERVYLKAYDGVSAARADMSLSGILCLRHTMSITEGDKYAEASQEDAES